MKSKVLIDSKQFDVTLQRLCFQLIENHIKFENTVIIGLQPRGVLLADKINTILQAILKRPVNMGALDVTFYRDDFRTKELTPNKTNITFTIENKKVILIDDVLYTGRTIRAGLDAMLAFGRPQCVELLVLVDRKFSRHLPIEAKYVGIEIDSVATQNVRVEWEESNNKNKVTLLTNKHEP